VFNMVWPLTKMKDKNWSLKLIFCSGSWEVIFIFIFLGATV